MAVFPQEQGVAVTTGDFVDTWQFRKVMAVDLCRRARCADFITTADDVVHVSPPSV
eukprot:CAMPEP_0181536774 /NCGR_PEP_ID=MMETSP1110-20121109/75005_1 /TAXON_ID=174948 /ORGANISM="Symbiodinium sp., Strain CCMP421" /LENGTH=55 /DNA_ID=CAMNT_0023668317 /DNA_START=101 /DNA_END=264 /DNA_ORIENTATION=-